MTLARVMGKVLPKDVVSFEADAKGTKKTSALRVFSSLGIDGGDIAETLTHRSLAACSTA
jgi:hypothetical protein